jgi:hypothetical protein
MFIDLILNSSTTVAWTGPVTLCTERNANEQHNSTAQRLLAFVNNYVTIKKSSSPSKETPTNPSSTWTKYSQFASSKYTFVTNIRILSHHLQSSHTNFAEVFFSAKLSLDDSTTVTVVDYNYEAWSTSICTLQHSPVRPVPCAPLSLPKCSQTCTSQDSPAPPPRISARMNPRQQLEERFKLITCQQMSP